MQTEFENGAAWAVEILPRGVSCTRFRLFAAVCARSGTSLALAIASFFDEARCAWLFGICFLVLFVAWTMAAAREAAVLADNAVEAALEAVRALPADTSVADLAAKHRDLSQQKKAIYREVRKAKKREQTILKKASKLENDQLLGIVASRLHARPSPKRRALGNAAASSGSGTGADAAVDGSARAD